MILSWIDIAVIIAYLVSVLLIGLYISKRASQNMDSYFLGGKTIPWWALGVSNASGMFDIAGTMWLVSMCFVYGLKSAWLPWIWPIFNQIFLMIYLSVWLRRSNVMTGAQWMETRFGTGKGAEMSQMVVVIFALVSAIGFIAYAFKGIGKFAAIFFPWELSPDIYALIIFSITTIYVVKGGMYSVVFTEILQFVIMTIAAISVGVIAMYMVSPEQLAAATPQGWNQLFFDWRLDLNWQGLIDSVNVKVEEDGLELFGLMIMMMLFKGVLSSMAGPVPNYDMQRILATKSPKDAAKMSGLVSLVMFFPRYMMVAGLSILAIVYMGPDIQAQGTQFDFEQILPFAINNFVPVGLTGLLIAGLLAAFMSTYAASVNAAPAYFVNDIYRRYLRPDADSRTYVRMSYIVSIVLVVLGMGLGLMLGSINAIMQWIFAALFGGYAAANLLKWHWWRFNAYGYFWGMLAGLIGALVLPIALPDVQPLMAFPLLLIFGLVGSIAGTLLTPPESDDVLCEFYRTVKPWGAWGPIRDKVIALDPDFAPNRAFYRDMFNVAIGIVWQIGLVVMPIYLVIQQWWSMLTAFGVIVVTSWILKKNWLDKLPD
ncbi:MAG: sodium:solute symporter [Alteromonadaceae bacterium]|uniref:sodium:solute symporter family protein n=1 Tax=Paraglaciecola chathamensis TaxID=368405 RepID=UPI000C4E2EB1|nr:sodium:solute symporter family protein [Paraglaciecola agarilytica]MBN27547.1 sodium:solute symporter [Alteromonadaceae bacterium]|tara:strand:- start:11237 stop:13027 length:1791 start_codon:yes stop_codon:yes gene_type:complete